MPVYSIKEFAAITGKKPKDIHVYVGRGKVIKNSNSQIDSTNPINAEFMANNQSISIDVPEDKPRQKKQKPSNNTEQTESTNKLSATIQEKSDVDLKLKKLDLEKKELEIKKLRGELVNLQDTINTVGSYSDSLKRELNQELQTYIQTICERHGITDRIGEYKKGVTDRINKSSKKAVNELRSKL